MSSLRRGHANLLCIVPILTDDLRRESNGQCARIRAARKASCNQQRGTACTKSPTSSAREISMSNPQQEPNAAKRSRPSWPLGASSLEICAYGITHHSRPITQCVSMPQHFTRIQNAFAVLRGRNMECAARLPVTRRPRPHPKVRHGARHPEAPPTGRRTA